MSIEEVLYPEVNVGDWCWVQLPANKRSGDVFVIKKIYEKFSSADRCVDIVCLSNDGPIKNLKMVPMYDITLLSVVEADEIYKSILKSTNRLEVNNHYAKGTELDPWEIMRQKFTPEEYRGYMKGNILKYLMRFEHKGTPLQDLRKIEDHVKELIKRYEQNDATRS